MGITERACKDNGADLGVKGESSVTKREQKADRQQKRFLNGCQMRRQGSVYLGV